MEKNNAVKRKPRKQVKKKGSSHIFLGFAIVILVMLTGIGCGFFTAGMNTRSAVDDIRPAVSSQIYDINGKEIANIHATEHRVQVKLDKVPKNLQDAFIAVEDARFYDHLGIDPRGILRAIWSNITNGSVAEGGSTITQQLAKNAYLTQERTFKRKIQEMFLAFQLEKQYTKNEILEFYLNQIYFGQGAYGVQAAARTYFGKNVEDLDLNECAMLAGIPKSPNYYSPLNNLSAAQSRKAVVLDQMVKYGYIDSATALKTKEARLNLVKLSDADARLASYFIDYITQILIEKYGADAVYKNGLKIYTTLDIDMQKAAEAAMTRLPNFETDSNGIKQPQGALVAIDPHNGYIKAMVGGRGTDQFNRATMAERQPGSAFKPFVFVTALENNFSANTVIEDSPITIGDWSPMNYNRKFNGKVTLRTVAEQSLNVPTVRVAQKIGVDKIIYTAQEMGISTFVLDGKINDGNLAITLGGLTRGVTPLELTSAYGTFANHGVHVEPVAIIKVLDRNGKVLEEAQSKQKRVVSEASANELTDMLQGVVLRGTGTGADFGRPAAGKTGTADDYLNAWFVGYVPQLVAGVWVGCDDNTDLDGMTGGELPATIWRLFMQKALEHEPVKNFEGGYSSKSNAVKELLDPNGKKKDDKKNDKNKKKTTSNTKKETVNNGPREDKSNPANEKVTTTNNPPQSPTAAPSSPGPSTAPTPGFNTGKGKN